MALSDQVAELRSKQMQEVFYKTNVGTKICENMNGEAITKYGDKLHRPYRAPISVQQVTRGVDMTIDSPDATDESMEIDQTWGTAFAINDFDAVQSQYELALLYGKDAGMAVSNKVDADVLGEVLNSGSTVDDGSIGGTPGNGITLSISNVMKTMGAAKTALKKKDITSTDIYGAISPEFEAILIESVANRATTQGDEVGKNGYIGEYYGVDIYVSNNLTSTAELLLATQPTANETVTISGQVFTFVSTIGSTAGNVLIGANVDATRANLATLINAPATTTATGVALGASSSAVVRRFVAYITASNNNTTDTLTVTGKGQGVLTVSETLSAVADVWTPAKRLQRNLFGIKGNPVLVVQKTPRVSPRQETKQETTNYLTSVLYKTKTFADNSVQMVDVRVRCDAYT